MIRNKYILTPFLLLAWAVIFAHSVIPHHHHVSYVQSECHHGHNNLENVKLYNDCDHDCSDHACHFHVDVLTKISIDQVFIATTDNNYTSYLIERELLKFVFDKAFFSDQILKTNYLRGPPMLT